MPADTPQPGKTPHGESDPWSFADPGATWWRGQTDHDGPPPGPGGEKPATVLLPPAAVPRTGDDARAQAAGAQDTADELRPAVERDHDQPDAFRYQPPTVADGKPSPADASVPAVSPPPASPSSAAPPPAPESPDPQSAPQSPDPQSVPQSPAPPPPAEDVMVLPEPSVHHRPTVPLDHPMAHRARPSVVPQVRPTEPIAQVRPAEPVPQTRPTEPVPQARPTEPVPQARSTEPVPRVRPTEPVRPARPTEPLPPPTGTPATDARLRRLENSPFWRDPADDTIEVPPGEEPAPVLTRARHRGQGRATRKHSGRPLSAQASLIALGLVAAFFAWVSAEPFWLAAGHGDQGYATTTTCTGDGVTQRCAGRFTSADGRYTMTGIRLVGVEGPARQPGAITPARMVSPDSRQAYLGATEPLLHLRWLLGFALVLFCGYAIAGVTKARQLETARARRAAVLLSLAGPLALLCGFLAAAY